MFTGPSDEIVEYCLVLLAHFHAVSIKRSNLFLESILLLYSWKEEVVFKWILVGDNKTITNYYTNKYPLCRGILGRINIALVTILFY